MAITTRYFKIIGTRDEDDGTVTHTIRQVADYLGTPIVDASNPEQTYNIPAAQEKPRGTIVKVVDTTTRALTVNPTS